MKNLSTNKNTFKSIFSFLKNTEVIDYDDNEDYYGEDIVFAEETNKPKECQIIKLYPSV